MQVNWSDNFERLYKQWGQHKCGIRLRALWKIQGGMSETQLSTLIGKTHKTTHLWRKFYEAGGIDALLSIKLGRGRKARIDHKAIIEDAVEHLSRQRKGGGGAYEPKILLVFLRKKNRLHTAYLVCDPRFTSSWVFVDYVSFKTSKARPRNN